MLIGEIQRNEKEKYRISIEEFKGHRFISCRLFFESDKSEWLPTKKGITLNAGNIDEVIKALQEAGKALKEGKTAAC